MSVRYLECAVKFVITRKEASNVPALTIIYWILTEGNAELLVLVNSSFGFSLVWRYFFTLQSVTFY